MPELRLLHHHGLPIDGHVQVLQCIIECPWADLSGRVADFGAMHAVPRRGRRASAPRGCCMSRSAGPRRSPRAPTHVLDGGSPRGAEAGYCG